MKRRRARVESRGTNRRWHIPPPLIHGAEPLEGGAVLAENPGKTGLVLWQALRDVLLWAETPTDERKALFAAGAARLRRETVARAVPEGVLATALPALTDLLDDPADADGEAVADACASIAGWAEERGALGTALAFAQDAALAAPNEAAPAFAVARLAVRLDDHARAEVWYRRSIGIARRACDWRLYARSFSGLGSLYQSRGNLPGAQRFHLRALRGARRGGLRVERAVALHDLFGLSVEAGRAREAQRYAQEAFAAYPARSARIAVLAHDVAYFWMEQGLFQRALAVFQAVAPLIDRPAERLWVQADLMRAAAGAGEAALARQLSREVRAECRRPDLAAAAARAHLELARGELQLNDLKAAEEAALAALQLATERRDGRTILMAESLLDAVRNARAAGRPDTLVSTTPADHGGPAGESLADEMIRTLQELASPVFSGGNAEREGGESNVIGPKRPSAHSL
jgi:tetratricopeptide (TPR) repeat protein